MSPTTIAINGYGRIGRSILRALFETQPKRRFRLLAVNDKAPPETLLHLTRFDSTHGRFGPTVSWDKSYCHIQDQAIRLLQESNPNDLPWQELGVDLVLECTGRLTHAETASLHLKAGAKKVLISAPATGLVDATVVYGVNHKILKSSQQIVSNASCTTNCLAPIAKILHQSIGIESGLMNTVHSYTNDQVLLDSSHSDLHRARSAIQSMIPTKTGAAAAVGIVLPELAGKLDGLAIRVPTANVSLVDFTFVAARPTSANEITDLLKQASETSLKDILAINEEPLVSCDFNHNPASAIYEVHETRIQNQGRLVKILAWYDNEWGFANRMLDVANYWTNL